MFTKAKDTGRYVLRIIPNFMCLPFTRMCIHGIEINLFASGTERLHTKSKWKFWRRPIIVSVGMTEWS